MFVEELKNSKEWTNFLQAHPEGTFYHSLKWKEVLQNSLPYSPSYLTIRDANGTLVGICPGFILDSMHMKVYDSTPHSDYGGPLILRDCLKNASLSLLGFLQSFCSDRGIAYAKICFMNNELVQSIKSPLSYLDTSTGKVEIDLKVTPSEVIWKKVYSVSKRKKIRLVERDGFQCQEARSKSDLRDFYNLYYRNMKYIGSPPYPYDFMENMWKILYPESLRIWLVGKEKRIGGIAVFKGIRKIHWVYVGIDRERCSSRYSVIPYLLWKEIETAEEEGYRYISLGATPNDPTHPYYRQKLSFGGSFLEQKIVRYPFSFRGHVLLQTRTKAILAWKNIRDFLPNNLKSTLQEKLSLF